MALLVAVPVAACSSSSSSTSDTTNAAIGTGNKVHPGWPTTLVFGSVGEDNATTLLQSLAPIQDVLKAKLGIHLTVVTGTSYAAAGPDGRRARSTGSGSARGGRPGPGGRNVRRSAST